VSLVDVYLNTQIDTDTVVSGKLSPCRPITTIFHPAIWVSCCLHTHTHTHTHKRERKKRTHTQTYIEGERERKRKRERVSQALLKR
jgi:hypothetical protein